MRSELERIVVCDVAQHPRDCAILGISIGASQLSPDLLTDHGPDLSFVRRAGVWGEIASASEPPYLFDRDEIVDVDDDRSSVHVELHGIDAGAVDLLGVEDVLEGTGAGIESDEGGEEVARPEGALLHGGVGGRVREHRELVRVVDVTDSFPHDAIGLASLQRLVG